MAKRKNSPIGDAWTLETPDEELAAEDLNVIVDLALANTAWARNYLKKLWPEDSWKRIKEKLTTEGSVWYVWWMDGVRQHAINMTAQMELTASGKSKVKKGKKSKRATAQSVVRGMR